MLNSQVRRHRHALPSRLTESPTVASPKLAPPPPRAHTRSLAHTPFVSPTSPTANLRRQWHTDDGYNACVVPSPDGAQWVASADPEGRSTLLLACERGQRDVAMELLERGSDPNAADASGWTPLMWACVYGHTEVVQALLDCGAHLSAANDAGITALILASHKGHREITSLLLAAEREGAAAGTIPRVPLRGTVSPGREIARRMGLPALRM